MLALVLSAPGDLGIRDVDDPGPPGPGEVRVRVGAVGICGSDVHYYEHGRIGDFVVEAPMILGHECAGTIVEVGDGVRGLGRGDLVAMEPGVPCRTCDACRAGTYNLCRDVRFWATPPFDGSLAEYIVHPADFTYRLPPGVSLAEGALMEPLAVAVHACNRGRLGPGSSAAIAGAGTIGSMCLLAARAYGASTIVVSDVVPERLSRARDLGATLTVDARQEELPAAASGATGGRGVSVGFDASGHPSAPDALVGAAAPGGRVVLIGMGSQPVPIDTVAAMVKEVDLLPIFRYRHAYPTAIDLVASGRADVSPLVTDRFSFERAVEALEFARSPKPATCKVLIEFE